MVSALLIITLLSYLVWLHHFFTMGAGPRVNAFFGIVTMLIAIPAGVQVFNWIFTMYRGKVHFSSPMYWFVGFLITFMIGGMSGIFMASPPADFQVHNTLFLVAHFHTMVIGIAIFGTFAGITYWFPKIFGIKLDEELGKRAFWLWIIGFFVSFTPLYILGFMGATRRLDHYDSWTNWQGLYITSMIGFGIILWGLATQVYQIYVSCRRKEADTTGDPWNGRTLEWATSSPPPFYNFAVIPTVTDREEYWLMKKEHRQLSKEYKDIEMPNNTGMGLYIAVFGFLFSFAIVWHIPWLAAIGFVGVIACIITISFDEHREYILPAAKIAEIERSKGRG